MPQRFIPCSRKIVTPGKVDYVLRELPGDLLGRIGRARIDNDNLIEEAHHRL
jgi:hypothetical protein